MIQVPQKETGSSQSIPVQSGNHVQGFKVKWSRCRKFNDKPLKQRAIVILTSHATQDIYVLRFPSIPIFVHNNGTIPWGQERGLANIPLNCN